MDDMRIDDGKEGKGCGRWNRHKINLRRDIIRCLFDEGTGCERHWGCGLLVKMEEAEGLGRGLPRGCLVRWESRSTDGVVQNDLESDLKQMERKMGRLVKEREKRGTKRLQQSERMFQRVGKREAKIVQKVI